MSSPKSSYRHTGQGASAPGAPRAEAPDPQGAACTALRLNPTITQFEAEDIVRRKIGGGAAAATLVHHPFWSVDVRARRTRGPRFRISELWRERSTPQHEAESDGSTVSVMVDAKSGTSLISSIPINGVDVPSPCQAHMSGPGTNTADKARQLVATALRKRFRLGMNFELFPAEPRAVLKPNWVVEARHGRLAATLLVDGFDGSYWVMNAEKL